MAILAADPNVAVVHREFGGPGGGGGGRLNVDLKPRDRAQLTADQVIEELRPKLARVPASACRCRTRRRSASAACIRGRSISSRCRIPTPRSCYRVAPRLRDGAAQRAGTARRQLGPPDHEPAADRVDLDREQIAALGLTVDQVESALSSAYGSRQISQIFAPNDEYQVIMQVAPEFQQDPAALSMLYVQAPAASSCRCRRS